MNGFVRSLDPVKVNMRVAFRGFEQRCAVATAVDKNGIGTSYTHDTLKVCK